MGNPEQPGRQGVISDRGARRQGGSENDGNPPLAKHGQCRNIEWTIRAYNGSTWSSFWEMIQRSEDEKHPPMLYLGAETKRRAEQVAELSDSLLKKNWRSFWAPAIETKNKGISAGTVIVASEGIDVVQPKDLVEPVAEARASFAFWRSGT